MLRRVADPVAGHASRLASENLVFREEGGLEKTKKTGGCDELAAVDVVTRPVENVVGAQRERVESVFSLRGGYRNPHVLNLAKFLGSERWMRSKSQEPRKRRGPPPDSPIRDTRPATRYTCKGAFLFC